MKKLIGTKEAAELLGLRPNTLEVWRHKRRGPKYKKLGRRVLYDPVEIEEYALSCTVSLERTTRLASSAVEEDESYWQPVPERENLILNKDE